MKKQLVFLAAALLVFALSAPALAANIKNVSVDGENVVFKDVESQIIGNYVMIPARFVSEAMGYTFKWDSAKREAEIAREGFSSVFTENSDEVRCTLDGTTTSVKIDAPAVLKNNRMLIPEGAVKSLAARAGFSVLPDDVDRSIVLTSPGAVEVLVNGKVPAFSDCAPALVGKTAMVPARFVCEAMGLNFAWDAKAGLATVTGAGQTALFTRNSDEIKLGETVFKADSRVILNGNRLYASVEALKAMADFFGAEAKTDKNSLTINSALGYKVSAAGKEIAFTDVRPLYMDGKLMIPLRALCDGSGLKFLWYNSDKYATVENAEGTKRIRLDENSAELTQYVGETEEKKPLDTAVVLVDKRMVASVDTVIKIAGFFGHTVTYSETGLEIDPVSEESGNVVTATVEKNEIKVTYNGAEVIFPDAQCIMRDGRVLIPVRAVVEAMQMKVDWDGQGRSATIDNEGDTLKIVIDSASMEGNKNGAVQNVELDVPAVIINERIYVPIRAVMEFFGADVDWNDELKTVIIDDADKDNDNDNDNDKQPEESGGESTSHGGDGGFALLGFVIDAPEGAENVRRSVENGATARVEFSSGAAGFVFLASNGNDVSSRYGEVDGRRLSYGVKVNGVETKISAGALQKGGQIADWTVGSYKFSLYTADQVSRSDMFSMASRAAQTFVLTRETEDNGETGESSAEIPNPIVPSEGDFSALGLTLAAPEGAENVKYSTIAGEVAQAVFTFGENTCTLRGAITDKDISGVYSSFEEGYGIVSAEVNGEPVTVVTRRIVGGGRLALWSVGEASFSLYTAQSPSDEDFARLCVLCAAEGKVKENNK